MVEDDQQGYFAEALGPFFEQRCRRVGHRLRAVSDTLIPGSGRTKQ